MIGIDESYKIGIFQQENPGMNNTGNIIVLEGMFFQFVTPNDDGLLCGRCAFGPFSSLDRRENLCEEVDNCLDGFYTQLKIKDIRGTYEKDYRCKER